IMFLPFEGIYAEVVRKAALLEEIQSRYKVLITGPTTFAAILNSLQMGFRTLAIEKRSGEVWNILGAVKREFSTFGDLLTKAQKNIQGGLDDIDKLVGVRTRVIQKKLSSIETMDPDTASTIIGERDDLLTDTDLES
ncbi:MAG: DNA recombination protein RmuC, partial [Bacteroidales bacterium]|nr:DNA recombination protein RmuC [Bacteroidales bacterium]